MDAAILSTISTVYFTRPGGSGQNRGRASLLPPVKPDESEALTPQHTGSRNPSVGKHELSCVVSEWSVKIRCDNQFAHHSVLGGRGPAAQQGRLARSGTEAIFSLALSWITRSLAADVCNRNRVPAVPSVAAQRQGQEAAGQDRTRQLRDGRDRMEAGGVESAAKVVAMLVTGRGSVVLRPRAHWQVRALAAGPASPEAAQGVRLGGRGRARVGQRGGEEQGGSWLARMKARGEKGRRREEKKRRGTSAPLYPSHGRGGRLRDHARTGRR